MANLSGEGLVSRRGHSQPLRETSKDKHATIESFPVDETPTPTKILKMADEVGLFHDLRDNPFDAHFRKATEAVKLGADSLSASIAATEIPEEESLNTPHIYPAPGDTPGPSTAPQPRPVLLRANSRSRPLVPLTTRMPSILQPFVPVASVQPVKISGYKPIAPNAPIAPVLSMLGGHSGSVQNLGTQDGTENALLLLKFPSGETIKLSNLPFVKEETSLAGNVTVNSPTKLKLKETLINNTSSAAFASKRNNADSISDLAVVEAREANYDNYGITAGPSLPKMIRSSSVDEVDKKKDIQERNRASAQRSRNKKRDEFEKTFIRCKDLEKKTGMLEMENSILREEVVKLKTLLIKHSNCQITQDCNEQEQIKSIVEPRVITNLLPKNKSPIVINSPNLGEIIVPSNSIVMKPVQDHLKMNQFIKNPTAINTSHQQLTLPSLPKANSTQSHEVPPESFRNVNHESQSSHLLKEPELDAPMNLTSGSHMELAPIGTSLVDLAKSYRNKKDTTLNESPPQTVPEDLRVDHSKVKVTDSEIKWSSSAPVPPVREEVTFAPVNQELTQISSPGFVRVTPNSICVKQTLARHCQRTVSEKHEIREKKVKVAKRLKDKLLDLKMKMGEEIDSHDLAEASSSRQLIKRSDSMP